MTRGLVGVAPTLPPTAWMWRRPATGPPFPLDDPRCRLFSQARQGLWQALTRLKTGGGDELLVPAYHHGSEVETIAAAGFGLRFYGGGEALEPDEEELESLTGDRTRGLYLIHALGFPQDSERWRRWCDARGLALLEDCAQSWLSARDGVPVGSRGDVSIFCLYKMVGVPDGGALRTRPGLDVPAPPSRSVGVSEGRAAARAHRRFLAHRLAGVQPPGRDALAELRRDEVPARDFAASPDPTAPTRVTRRLACRVAAEAVRAARRRHFETLRDRLGEHLCRAFGRLSADGCPMAFPIEADDKNGMLDHLAIRGIREGQAWTVAHPKLPEDRFPLARRLRRSVVCLPVHQDLTESDLDRTATAVEEWLAGRRRR